MGWIKEYLAQLRAALFYIIIKVFKKNIMVGEGLKLYCRLDIQGPGKVIIGKNCIVKSIPGSRNQYVTLYTTSPEAIIEIGDNVQLISAKTSCNFRMRIGNNVIIEDTSLLDSSFHSVHEHRERPTNESHKNSAINIEDNVLVGVRSVIMRGVRLGRSSQVLPCSVVQSSFPENSVIIGNPAGVLKDESS